MELRQWLPYHGTIVVKLMGTFGQCIVICLHMVRSGLAGGRKSGQPPEPGRPLIENVITDQNIAGVRTRVFCRVMLRRLIIVWQVGI